MNKIQFSEFWLKKNLIHIEVEIRLEGKKEVKNENIDAVNK